MQWHFLWPHALVAGLAVPALVWCYVHVERRRRRSAHRHPHLYAPQTQFAEPTSFARHLPISCFVAALSLLALALARPSATVEFLAIQGKVVLVVDVSTSMRANDVQPTRLDEAKKLAKRFVASNSDALRIALVSFAGTAVAETDFGTGREEHFYTIDKLSHRHGTSVGRGIIEALALIFPQIDFHALARAIDDETAESRQTADPSSGRRSPKRIPGSYDAAAIVLLSDGQSAVGPAPATAARLAAEHGVRVHTIGIGTDEGSELREAGRSMRVQLDAASLRQISKATAGVYARADSADWSMIVASIRPDPQQDATYTEVTAIVAGLAALIALLGALISLRSTHRIL